jgi:divalent metal cation (Fe/Co/Zn/Cd) transporter
MIIKAAVQSGAHAVKELADASVDAATLKGVHAELKAIAVRILP